MRRTRRASSLILILAALPLLAEPRPQLSPATIEKCRKGKTTSIPLFCTHSRKNLEAACMDPEWAPKQTRTRDAQLFVQGATGQAPGEGIRIGQLDTGYTKHPANVDALDLDATWDVTGKKPVKDAVDRFKKCPLYCDPGHGTKTASLAIGETHFSEQGWIVGVAPAAKFVPIRGSNGPFLLSGRKRDMARGICLLTGGVVPNAYDKQTKAHPVPFCVDPSDPLAKDSPWPVLETPVDIIMIARGGRGPGRDLGDAIAHANERGVIIVAASGDCESLEIYPANSCYVISVGSTTVEALPWGDTPHAKPGVCGKNGLKIDIVAPGETIWRAETKRKDGNDEYLYGPGNGTSFSVPQVAGAAALWLQVNRAQIQATLPRDLVPSAFWYVLKHHAARLPASICEEALSRRHEWNYSDEQVETICTGKETPWNTKRQGPGILDVDAVVRAPLPTRATVCSALAGAERPLPPGCTTQEALRQ